MTCHEKAISCFQNFANMLKNVSQEVEQGMRRWWETREKLLLPSEYCGRFFNTQDWSSKDTTI
jgi:hypothetical protein